VGWGPDDTIFYPPPMMHNANMVCGWGPALLAGVRNVIVPDPDGRDFARVMIFHKPTWIGITRAILMRITDAVAGKLISFASLRGVMSMNASELVRRELRTFGAHVFGMTEGVVMMTDRHDPLQAQDRTVGRPLSPLDEVRLLKPGTEQDAAPGELGELAVRGPYTIHGYFDAPAHDARAFTSDGYYRTGDLMSRAVYEGRTYYVFEGRLKDVVDRGGEKISCEEVELAVGAHGSVADCAVVPMPCPTFGERACAFIVPRQGKGIPALPELQAHLLRYGLAKFKWPERIEAIDVLPTTKAGKPDKQSLRTLVASRVGAQRDAAATHAQ
jgi:non-ribosomal peptide synthetase component E (peptide arylation enzyme)